MLKKATIPSDRFKILEKNLKVALVCDWLTVVGGAEQVLREIHQIFPDAPIYTSQYRPKKIDWFKDAEVKTGWLNFFPAIARRFIAPLRQNYFKHLDLTDYDLVISVSGCDAKFIKSKKGTHFCYCHVPTQYYWGKTAEYLKDPGFGPLNFIVRPIFRFLLPSLRKKDLEAASRPDYYITISEFAQSEIKKYYKRESKIIYPPVNIVNFSEVAKYKEIGQGNCQILEQHKKQKSQISRKIYKTIENSKSQINIQTYQNIKKASCQTEIVENSEKLSDYFINFSRQVSWKRLDLAIKACIKENEKLLLIGDGPEHQALLQLAKQRPDLIVIKNALPQSELKEYLKHAKAFLFPSEEPFGIAPVEALAAGCPVIAFNQGGARDYLLDGQNGIFFDSQTVNSLAAAIKKYNTLFHQSQNQHGQNFQRASSEIAVKSDSPLPPLPLSPSQISQTAEKFSSTHFRESLQDYILENLISTSGQD